MAVDPRIRRLDHVRPGILPTEPDVPERRRTANDRVLDESKIESTVVGDLSVSGDLTVEGTFAHEGTLAGFNGAPPVVQGGPFVQTYATSDLTLSAYASDAESVAYTGIATGVGGTPYAQLTDLNALRQAYETLRIHTEDLSAFVNSLVDYLQTRGDVG